MLLSSKIMIRFLITYLFVLANLKPISGQYDNELSKPLDLPILLSGTFGEPRASHFHLGIDIRTEGKEGWEVKSIEKGYVSRIRISLNGYGKVLYIDHPNQTTSVYAHLKKFAPKIESYIKDFQYQKESYLIHKFLKNNELVIGKNEVIGYSGNTGSSSGPHLHFEIRDTKSQRPLNPLLFGFAVKDRLPPRLQKLYLFNDNENKILPEIQEISLIKENDSLYKTPLINTSGIIGIGIQMFDRQDSSYYKNGVYSTKVVLNGKIVSLFKFDELVISESSKLYMNIDYKNYVHNKIKIQKLFYKGNKKLNFMKLLINKGLFYVEPGKSYEIKIEVSDFFGNKSKIVSYIEGEEKEEKKINSERLNGILIDPSLEYSFKLNRKELFIPKQTFLKPH